MTKEVIPQQTQLRKHKESHSCCFRIPLDRYLLSTMANAKYNTTNSKLIPHARWTDPLGSAAHDRNKRSKTPFESPLLLGISSKSSPLSPVMVAGFVKLILYFGRRHELFFLLHLLGLTFRFLPNLSRRRCSVVPCTYAAKRTGTKDEDSDRQRR